MFVIIELSLMLLIAVLMMVSYFTIERIKGTQIVLDLRINKLFTEIITGIIYGGLFILYQLIATSAYSHFTPQIFLFGFVVLVMVTNYRVAAFSLLCPFIYFLLTTPVDSKIYVQWISFLSVAMVFETISFFAKATWIKWITYAISLMIGLVAFIVLSVPLENGFSVETFRVTLFWFILLPIFESIISYAIRVSISANILYESINYSFGSYYRPSLKNSVIGSLITEKKITQGFYGIFDIKFKQQDTNEKQKEILESSLVDLQKTLPRSTILFKTDKFRYGFFLPTKIKDNISLSLRNNILHERTSDDSLKSIEKLLTSASRKYRTSWDSLVMVNIFAGVSIYGVQDSSLEKLNEGAEFAIKTIERSLTNRVSLFNPKMLKTKIVDSHNVQNLDMSISLDDYANRFMPIIDVKTEEQVFNYAFQINTSSIEFIGEVRTFVLETGMIHTFDRYFAVDALQKIKHNKVKILINYSFGIFIEDFNEHEFFRQLKLMKVDPSKIVLIGNASEVKNISNVQLMTKIMSSLREKGIEFAIKGIEKVKIKTEFRIVSASEINKFNDKDLNNKIIIIDIDTEEKLEFVLNRNPDYIGGSLFEINNKPNNLEKQSKIYIEQILKEKR